jgi:hypothetical protein
MGQDTPNLPRVRSTGSRIRDDDIHTLSLGVLTDLNVRLYRGPSEASIMTPGVEKGDGEWRIAGFRTMGTTTTHPTGG